MYHHYLNVIVRDSPCSLACYDLALFLWRRVFCTRPINYVIGVLDTAARGAIILHRTTARKANKYAQACNWYCSPQDPTTFVFSPPLSTYATWNAFSLLYYVHPADYTKYNPVNHLIDLSNVPYENANGLIFLLKIRKICLSCIDTLRYSSCCLIWTITLCCCDRTRYKLVLYIFASTAACIWTRSSILLSLY